MSLKSLVLTCTSCVALTATHSYGASLAYDDASQSPYSGGNYAPGSDARPSTGTGLNGGSGFQAWNWDHNTWGSWGGTFLKTASDNGWGGGGAGGAIDTVGKSFGIYTEGDRLTLTRQFTSGGSNNSAALATDQKFTMGFDNGGVDWQVGVAFRNSLGNDLLHFDFNTNNGYELNGTQLSQGWMTNGMMITLSLPTSTTFDFQVDFLNIDGSISSTQNLTGSLLNPTGGQGIDRVAIYAHDSGNGDQKNLYFNKLSIIPEPSVSALMVAGLSFVWMFRRRPSRV